MFYGDSFGGFMKRATAVAEVGVSSGPVKNVNADLVPDLFVLLGNGTRGVWEFEGPPANASAALGSPAGPAAMRWRPWPSGVTAECRSGDVVVALPAFFDMDGDCLLRSTRWFPLPARWRFGVARARVETTADRVARGGRFGTLRQTRICGSGKGLRRLLER